MRRLRRAYRFVGVALAAAIVAVGSLQTPALASAQPIIIVGTGGQGVNMRPSPDTTQGVVGRIPEGASPDYLCYSRGQNIGGTKRGWTWSENGKTWLQHSYPSVRAYLLRISA